MTQQVSKILVAAAGASLLAGCMTTATAASSDANHSGTWVMDADRSSWSDGTMPKGMSLAITLDFSEAGVRYDSSNDTCFLPQYRGKGFCKKATKPYSVKYTASFDGKPTPASNPAGHYNVIEMVRFNANEYEVRKMKDGKIITAEWWMFSADGKEFVRRGMAIKSNHTYDEYFSRKAAE